MEKNFIIAGFGGQGVLLAGEVLANAFMFDDKNVTWYPSYGAEMRGGTVNCEIVMSDEEVSSVNKSDADFVIALNQASFDRFLPKIKKGGLMIANSTLTKEVVEKGYQYYDWNGDSTDASGNHVAVDKLIRNGTSCHDNNVMILCHDTQAKDTTVQALPAIIEHYKNLGYTFKGIDDATYAPHQSVNN